MGSKQKQSGNRGRLITEEPVLLTTKGYWLVTQRGRFFIGAEAKERALEKVCNSELREEEGWEYWVDYCHGADIQGRPAWANLDLTDHFF